ncbi:MAG: 5-methylthioadenosine/S-adenosylhomocysteine deaminase [Halioglobus sp.]|jgi:5-methylthioadenosine/S-adenosylhomocysteine deaminase
MSSLPEFVDTLIHPGWIIPVIPEGDVLTGFSIALRDDKIVAILPTEETTYITARDSYTLPEHALIPGLINAHGHAAMSLLRGYADDLPLAPWLEKFIWPAESAHVSEEFVRDGVELAIAEMIRSGTTSFTDMYFFPDITSDTAQLMGMRCQIAFPVLDFPTLWARDGDEYINKGLSLRDKLKHSELVSVVFGPHSPYTVNEENLTKVATLAAELDVAVHIHLHETPGEVHQGVEQNGERPIDTLYRLGLLGPKTQCVHMTDLGEQDIDLLQATAAHVIHCPASNMKLASGTCPVSKLLARGINVALGTDGAASNNSLNLFNEIRTAALLAKLHTGDASALSAPQALSMATINGARAMGMGDSLGSIEVGKLADLVALDMNNPETMPLYNPLSQLVYACNGSQVTHSWINGKLVLEDKTLKNVDLNNVMQKTQKWRHRIGS